MRILFLNINLAIIIACSMVISNCYADKPYLKENRLAYISNVLQAFNDTTKQKIFNTYSYMNVVDSNYCRSSFSDLRTDCLLSYAKSNCEEIGVDKQKSNCELYSDIIVVNILSENIFVNRSERYRMLKNTDFEFRNAMASRLQQKYARIVVNFLLSKDANCDNSDPKCLARELDQFCLVFTNTQSLSWQYCVSASLWFIGTSKKE